MFMGFPSQNASLGSFVDCCQERNWFSEEPWSINCLPCLYTPLFLSWHKMLQKWKTTKINRGNPRVVHSVRRTMTSVYLHDFLRLASHEGGTSPAWERWLHRDHRATGMWPHFPACLQCVGVQHWIWPVGSKKPKGVTSGLKPFISCFLSPSWPTMVIKEVRSHNDASVNTVEPLSGVPAPEWSVKAGPPTEPRWPCSMSEEKTLFVCVKPLRSECFLQCVMGWVILMQGTKPTLPF